MRSKLKTIAGRNPTTLNARLGVTLKSALCCSGVVM